MTATRERQNATPAGAGVPPWSERAAFGTSRGVPLWAAILLAVVPTIVGTALGMLISSKPGLLFEACFLVGCTLSVALCRRKNVFGPMVQPPLVAALAMPLVVMVTGKGASGGGVTAQALAIVQPLISSFPVMAITTAISVGFGLTRMFLLQPAKKRTPADESEIPTKKRKSPPAPKADPNEEPPRRRRPAEGAQKRPAPPRERPEERGGRPARRRPAPDAEGKQPGPRGEGRPQRGERATPPGRGRPPRPAPGRGRPPEPDAEPPRRPRRRPRRGDSFD